MQCTNNVINLFGDDAIVTEPGPARNHKRCPRCTNLLPLDRFGEKRNKKDGPWVPASYCFKCYRIVAKERSAAHPEYARKWRAANREKLAMQHDAHEAVRAAKRKGILVMPSHCEAEGCGKPGKGDLVAHHWSYAEEHHLDVEWLCHACHHRHHADHGEGLYPDVEMVALAA